MRLRNIAGSREVIAQNEYVIHDIGEYKGQWKKSVFESDNPLHVEIGMGKGQFLLTLAKQNPDINYVGVEKYSSVLLRALQKMDIEPLPNVRFIRMDAEDVLEVFDKAEVDRIYLNFSDPWPKDRHAKRRLPSRQFLDRYDQILTPEGRIEFKTDNRDLFDFAVEEVPFTNWTIQALTYDLHHTPDMFEGNVMTEYEEKFSSMGNPICKYILVRK